MDDEKDFLQFLKTYDKISFTLIQQEYETMKKEKILASNFCLLF